MAELLSTLDAPAYIERVALSDNKNIMKARRAIRKALEIQREGIDFSFVEILSPCPTIWGMDPMPARKWIAEQMIPVFPLQVFRDHNPEVTAETAPLQRSVEEVVGLPTEKAGEPTEKTNYKHDFHRLTLKIAGFGGQGVLLLGQLLAEAGMREGLEVSWLPSYGPEMRSGSTHCHVCLSRERIGSPLISHPDVLIAMNEISLRKFAAAAPSSGLILYNGTDVPPDLGPLPCEKICVPASEIADKLGCAIVANMVLLGGFLENAGCLEPSTALAVLQTKTRKIALLEANRKALEEGRKFVSTEWAV